jgi:hypothetical protein
VRLNEPPRLWRECLVCSYQRDGLAVVVVSVRGGQAGGRRFVSRARHVGLDGRLLDAARDLPRRRSVSIEHAEARRKPGGLAESLDRAGRLRAQIISRL